MEARGIWERTCVSSSTAGTEAGAGMLFWDTGAGAAKLERIMDFCDCTDMREAERP